jgi:hypothetical protein
MRLLLNYGIEHHLSASGACQTLQSGDTVCFGGMSSI